MSIHPLPVVRQDESLFRRAHQGDEDAFKELIMPWRAPLLAYLYRMIGHWEDAEDLLQDMLIVVMECLRRQPPPAELRGWLFKIATRACLEHLSAQRRWRIGAQVMARRSARSDPEATRLIGSITSNQGFVFEIREHIAFCLTCVGRTLAPIPIAVLMMREIFGLSEEECAGAVDTSVSVAAELLRGARLQLIQQFTGLCGLIDPKGRCDHCLSFDQGGPGKERAEDLFGTPGGHDAKVAAQALLETRLRIAREADLEKGRTRKFHRFFFDGLTHQESPTW